MSESERNANEEILNPPNNADLTEIAGAARDEETQAPVDTESRLKYELERLQLENTRLADENEELKDVHELRKEYVPNLFVLTVVWLAAVIVIVWRVAEGPHFYLSDNVLIALITSTTVNVIGIFVIAARWLFPHKK
jgi:uncharacterized ion transporter superfamily protein YfcC